MYKNENNLAVTQPEHGMRNCRFGSKCFAVFVVVLVLVFCFQSPTFSYDKFEAIQNGLVVKYVNKNTVYLRGGSGFGLAAGQQLEVKRSDYEPTEIPEGTSEETKGFSISETIATIKIISVADLIRYRQEEGI